MKTTVQHSIDKPCKQPNANFTKTPLSGFCKSCNKKVIDFTKMTDKQLIHYFSKAKDETCGRLLKSQLKTYEYINQRAMNHFLSKSAGIASFSLLALCTTSNGIAQDMAAVDIVPTEQIDPSIQPLVQQAVLVQSYTVQGIVLDEEKQPLPGVNVVLKGSTTGTQTDFEGRFAFPQSLDEGDVLVFSYLGYETKTYKIKAGESATTDISIQFKASDVILMGEVVVGGIHKTKRTFFQKIGDWFR